MRSKKKLLRKVSVFVVFILLIFANIQLATNQIDYTPEKRDASEVQMMTIKPGDRYHKGPIKTKGDWYCCENSSQSMCGLLQGC